MLTLKVLAALLDYPMPSTIAALGEMRTVLESEGKLDGALAGRLRALLDALAGGDLLDHQAAWVDQFDRSRALSLHLFEHVHGDSRDRGQAMVDLTALYESHGLAIEAAELPDYLPLFLEFLSLLPEAEALDLLGEAGHVIEALAERLEARGSAYAAVLSAVAALADGSTVARLPLSTSDQDDDIDAAWEEEAVLFSPGAAPNCSSAGLK